MNQSELIEKVAQATELNHAAAGHAVKAAVNAILDALLAGDAVRVYGLGIFNVAARPAREGRNPQTGETIQIAASKVVRFHQARPSKMPSIRRLRRRLPGRSLHHQRNPRCESKTSSRCAGRPGLRQVLWSSLAARAWAYPALRMVLGAVTTLEWCSEKRPGEVGPAVRIRFPPAKSLRTFST
jgi:DNA-binding protein HU-beta